MGLALCFAAFVFALLAANRSLAAGIGAVLAVGWFYGIIRANYPDGYSHFMFDAAVFGLYLMQFGRPNGMTLPQGPLRTWIILFTVIPLLAVVLVPLHPFIQLVGLRGNLLLLPFIVLGTRLSNRETSEIAMWMLCLNLIACSFAALEFVVGIERFYPQNAVTELIYRSRDVAGHQFYRIPATFNNAHAFGGTMVATMPWLLGAWMEPGRFGKRLAFGIGLFVSLLGVFVAAARTHVVVLFVLLIVATLSSHLLRRILWLPWIIMLLAIAFLISSEQRLQRFLTMQDTEYVVGRVAGSVNMSFFDIVATYPLGNGMGSGSSIPFFLQQYAPPPVGLENEYCRIALEQGLPGLLVWVAFVFWFAFYRPPSWEDSWWLPRRLLTYSCLVGFAMALIGTGLFTAIPQSALFLLSLGWVLAPHHPPALRQGRLPAPFERPAPMAPTAS